jgi:hypothetical protein
MIASLKEPPVRLRTLIWHDPKSAPAKPLFVRLAYCFVTVGLSRLQIGARTVGTI